MQISADDHTDNWQRVYLATYPRSGNHWMRFLLEEVTGVATSSVYRDKDPPHDPAIFPWGGYSIVGGYIQTAQLPTPDDFVVIKTHYPALHTTDRDKKPYVKTIRIIRHPVDSFYSHYCYRNNPPKIIPMGWLAQYVDIWARFQQHWDEQPDVVSIRYEDLLQNPFENLKRILTSVGYDISDEKIQNAIIMYPPFGEPLKHSIRYTQDELDFVNDRLQHLMKKYGYTISDVDYHWTPTQG